MSAKNTNIERRLVAAYAVEPAGGFVDRLEKDLLVGKVRGRRLPVPTGLRLVWAAAALVVLLGAMLATPQGRAFAQEILRFFTRGGSDTQPVPTAVPLGWVDITPGVPVPTRTPRASFAECGDFTSPKCSVEQIRSKVDFQIWELGTIPQSLHFVGATGGPDRVFLFYDNGLRTYGLVLIEEPWTGNSELVQWEIGASAVVETVQIGNVSGEYVKGGFLAPDPGQVNQVWDVNAGMQTLHWVEHGIFFDMHAYGPNILMDRDAFTVLADGLTTEPVSSRQPPVSATATLASISFHEVLYDLSVSQAEEQAGFDVLEPGRLPEVLTLAGASYRPEDPIVRIFYVEESPDPENTYGLTVAEEPAPIGGDCQLCGMAVGDYGDFLSVDLGMVVGAEAVIETVQVGESTGQYVEGLWMQSNWLPTPMVKTLRWQAYGMAFELRYFGFSLNNVIPITKADLIAIAESLK